VISSPNNPTIRRTRRLRKRAERVKRGAFIVEGHRAVRVALEQNHPLELVLHAPESAERHRMLLVDAADGGAQVLEATREVLGVLTSAANTPDLVAVARIPARAGSTSGPVLVLAGVRDPAAAGALLASAAASGIRRAIAVRGTADLYASTSVRTAAGAHFVLALREAGTVAEAVAGLTPVVALGADGPAPWRVDLSGAPALVIGDEAPADYDAVVTIPASAGAAAPLAIRGSVLMFEAMRQREAG
jgi:TrmH family RNA methyltransferase